jgi:hypothetical protein
VMWGRHPGGEPAFGSASLRAERQLAVRLSLHRQLRKTGK